MPEACLIGAVILVGIGVETWLAAAGRGAVPGAAPVVFWHEGEAGAVIQAGVGQTISPKETASGGACLQGAAWPHQGCTVRYAFDLPQAIDDGRIIFRYARLHWKKTMTPARLGVEVASGGETFKGEGTFADTKGWGRKPADWQLATVKLGALQAGQCAVVLTGLGDDNDICLDGFFIASKSFAISAAELALNRLVITSDGYVGLQSGTTVRQDTEPVLLVAARSFSQEPKISAAFGKTAESAAALKATAVETARDGTALVKFELPKADDGNFVLVVTGQRPACRLVAPLVLAGQFLASLDSRMVPLAAFAAEAAKSTTVADVRCAADFEHLVDYLKTQGQRLSNAAVAPVDAYKAGLAAHEGITNSAPLVDDLRRALAQGEETLRRLKAGQDPYAGRTGDLRRAYRSAISGDLRVYRVFVPDSYDKADKVPFFLMLHGGGGDENYYPNLDDGKVPKMLNQRGYLAAFPSYRSNFPNYLPDLAQLVELMRKEFPKIDPARIYCTGVSMGGFATYELATTYPDLFAGICPVSGVGDPARAEKLKLVPTLILQGGADEVVPPEGARKLAARMQELGETVELHIFPEYGHDYKAQEYLKLSLDFFEQHPGK